MALHVLVLLLPLCIVQVQSAKILGYFPLATRSHINVVAPLFKELAARGHSLTIVTMEPPGLKLPNVKELEIVEMKEYILKNEFTEIFKRSSANPLAKLNDLRGPLNGLCETGMASKVLQQLLKEGKQFDLVLAHGYMNECFLLVAHLLGEHLVLASPGPMTDYVSFPAPSYASFVPDKLFRFPSDMNFFQRVQNAIGTFAAHVFFQVILSSDGAKIVAKYVPNALTPTEAKQRASLLLLNTDPVLSVPHPTPPRIQLVGGMHLKETKPLPKEIASFIESSGDDGFIIFSLGSVVPSELMFPKTQEAFLSAFSRLKQKIIWKYNGKIEKLPKNVMLSSWLPQQDVLAHPKIRLFLAHGGLLGLQEAVYYGCPILGMPFLGDQPGNIARIKELGIGEELENFKDLTADEIYAAITNVIDNPKYAANAKKYSAVMRDHLVKPVNRAAYWVEYVLRHNGAHHLRSPGDDQSFIQYYLLDVVGFLLFTTLLLVGGLVFVMKILLRMCCRKKETTKQKKK